MKQRPIHQASDHGNPHPFKALTKCGRMVRFGGIEIPEQRPATCKACARRSGEKPVGQKERPILFSGPMVRAILDGRKSQTRRVVKWKPFDAGHVGDIEEHPEYAGEWFYWLNGSEKSATFLCPYGQPGNRLWVRETWADLRGKGFSNYRGGISVAYGLDTPAGSEGDRCRIDYGIKWKPSIHMPRWASRITLEITGVRVQRLQEISEEDAKAEGVEPLFTEQQMRERPEFEATRGSFTNYLWHGRFGQYGTGSSKSDRWRHQFSSYDDARGSFSSLWESINGTGSWDANSWVWVIEFKRVEVSHA